MADLHHKFYRLGNERHLFEVGYRYPEEGCHFVVNCESKTLERIYTVQIDFDHASAGRVETLPNRWYEIDGSTLFAKKIVDPGREPGYDFDASWEEMKWDNEVAFAGNSA